jgi:hypothetical protein
LVLTTIPAQAAATVDCVATSPSDTSYPPSQCSGTVSATSVSAGGTVTVGGSGFGAGNRVTFTLFPGGISLGSATANAAGFVSSRVSLPAGLSPGSYTIVLFEPETGRRLSVTIRVTGGTGGDDALAFTGSNLITPLAAGGGFLLLAAAGTVVVARRRRSESERVR